jgi:hypothetical protein
MAGVVILAGHYIDFFNMVMPGTVGDRWYQIACTFLLVIYLCSLHWLNILCFQREILTSKRVNIFIINI